jgi:hypothetical protein
MDGQIPFVAEKYGGGGGNAVPAALGLLWNSRPTTNSSADRWQDAVPLNDFSQLGLRRADLRQLVRDGLVEYRVEVTTAGSRKRRFQIWVVA